MRTEGRKSGAIRDVALESFVRRERPIVGASYVGEPRHPAWYTNFKADPQVFILEKGRGLRATAHDAQGDERSPLWVEFFIFGASLVTGSLATASIWLQIKGPRT